MNKPIFVDTVTHIHADWANLLSDQAFTVFEQARTKTQALAALGVGTLGLQNADAVQIAGGSINNATIGFAIPMQARFTVASMLVEPVAPDHLTNKRYVDNRWAQLDSSVLHLGGGTMSGPILLYGMPVDDREAASKAYVDQQVGLGGGGVSVQPLTWRSLTTETENLLSTDAGKALSFDLPGVTSATFATLTIGTDATMPMAVGSVILLFVENAAQLRELAPVIIVGQSGVTIKNSKAYNGGAGGTHSLKSKWSMAKLTKQAANTWVLDGDLTEPEEFDYGPIQRTRFDSTSMSVANIWNTFRPVEKYFDQNLFVYAGGLLLNQNDEYLLSWVAGKPEVRLISYSQVHFPDSNIVLDLVYINNTVKIVDLPPAVPDNVILLEDGTPILLEDGTFILLENSAAPPPPPPIDPG